MQFSSQPKIFRPRLMEQVVATKLRQAPAVEIVGSRGCGKSALAARFSASQLQVNANTCPDWATLLKSPAPHQLDEWLLNAKLPLKLAEYLKRESAVGQFLLTSSALDVHPHALIAPLRLRPLSLYESGVSSGAVSLQAWSMGAKLPLMAAPALAASDYAALFLRGGLPAALDLDLRHAVKLAKEQLQRILDQDLYAFGSRNFNARKVRLLLRAMARNLGQSVSGSALKKDIKLIDGGEVEDVTIAAYQAAFEHILLLDNQEPFTQPAQCKLRLKRAVKRHFVDPLYACALLNLNTDKILSSERLFSRLFASLCVRDLKIYAELMGAEVRHYLDYQNNAIDAVVQLKDGRWGAINFCLRQQECLTAANNLMRINEKIARSGGQAAHAFMVICAFATASCKVLPQVPVVPLSMLGA